MADLNRILDYTLISKEYTPIANEQKKIDDNPTYLKDDWFKSQFSGLKKNIKIHYSRKQKRKCAYCRSTISIDGIGFPIEHIIPRKLKPQWMFVQHNLTVCCSSCNSSKGSRNMMIRHENNYGHESQYYPNTSNEFKFFNPHFDKWSDHFEIQDDIFLVPKPNSKGPFTYKECNMHRYNIVIDYIDELRIREKSFKSITLRIRKEKNQKKLDELKLALEVLI